MNTKLLNKVALAILRKPLKFDMSWWLSADSDSPCGTTACIAGHIVAKSGAWKHRPLSSVRKHSYQVDISSEAKELIGVDWAKGIRLFHVEDWPECFGNQDDFYDSSREDQADITFWRIQHFIATEGAE